MMRVNVESSVATDPRFKKIGIRLKINLKEVVGTCYFVWLACYERRSAILSEEDIDVAADVPGFGGLYVSVGLAHYVDPEWKAKDPAERTILIHGAEERIRFLLEQQERGRKGGRKSAKSRQTEANAQASGQANAQASAEAKAQANTLALPLTPDLPQTLAQTLALPHARFIALFTEIWALNYEGKKYPFAGGKDGKAVKDILKVIGEDDAEWRAVLERYFADTWEGYHGHPITKLMGNLAKFMVDARPATMNGKPTLEQQIIANGHEFLRRGRA